MGHRLSHSDVAIDPRALQHDPDLGTKGPRALARVQAEHGHIAGGPLPVTLEDLDGGRLAGTVRPQQPEHLAAAHLEVDAPYRLEITIGLPQTADLDRWVGHRPDDASVGPAGGRPRLAPQKVAATRGRSRPARWGAPRGVRRAAAAGGAASAGKRLRSPTEAPCARPRRRRPPPQGPARSRPRARGPAAPRCATAAAWGQR